MAAIKKALISTHNLFILAFWFGRVKQKIVQKWSGETQLVQSWVLMYIELKGPKRISIPNFIQLFFWLFLRLPLGS